MRHDRIISELAELAGGQAALGLMLGVAAPQICRWKKQRRIPWRHWPQMMRLAARLGTGLSLRQLEAGSPRPQRSKQLLRAA